MGQKVLVFESDATFAADLRNELVKLGCNVQVVDDGNAGLQQATSAMRAADLGRGRWPRSVRLAGRTARGCCGNRHPAEP